MLSNPTNERLVRNLSKIHFMIRIASRLFANLDHSMNITNVLYLLLAGFKLDSDKRYHYCRKVLSFIYSDFVSPQQQHMTSYLYENLRNSKQHEEQAFPSAGACTCFVTKNISTTKVRLITLHSLTKTTTHIQFINTTFNICFFFSIVHAQRIIFYLNKYTVHVSTF